jgi:hypothetical protein
MPWADNDDLSPTNLTNKGLPVYSVKDEDYGAVGDGTTDDFAEIQAAIDAIDAAGVPAYLVIPPGSYYVSQEVQLRANNLTVLMHGAELIGPVAGTSAGGVLDVVDRDDLSRVLVNVSVYGGLVRPRNTSDNAINVAAGHHIKFIGMSADMTTGLRGIVIQTDQTFTSTAPVIRDVQVLGCSTFSGGTNGLNIESAGSDNLIVDVVVTGCVFRDASTPVRISGGGVTQRISRIVLSDSMIVGNGSATGVWVSRANDVKLSGLNIQRVGGIANNGIDVQAVNRLCISDVAVRGETAGNVAIGFDDLSGYGSDILLNGFQVSSAASWLGGVYVAHKDVVTRNGTIADCVSGVYTVAPIYRSVYENLTFASSTTTPVNTYRAGDVYRNFVTYSATSTAALGVLPQPLSMASFQGTLPSTASAAGYLYADSTSSLYWVNGSGVSTLVV